MWGIQASRPKAPRDAHVAAVLQVAELAIQAVEKKQFLVRAPDTMSTFMIAAGSTHPRLLPLILEILLAPLYVIMYILVGQHFDIKVLNWRRGVHNRKHQ